MNQKLTVLVSLAVVVGMIVGFPAIGMAAAEEHEEETDEDEDVDLSPGQELSAVVNVQANEVEHAVEAHQFANQLENADSDEEKAEIVAEHVEETEMDVKDVEEKKEELKELREEGEISEAQYHIEMAEAVSESQGTEKMADHAATAAEGVDDEALEEVGVDEEQLNHLKENASDLSGEEVSEIAQELAGPPVDVPAPVETPGEGPPEDTPGNGADNADNPDETDESEEGDESEHNGADEEQAGADQPDNEE